MSNYSAPIDRENPSCFVFLLDQSGSMADKIGGSIDDKSKAQGLSDAINRLLQNLIIRCTRAEGVRDYYDVSIIGYGANSGVGPALGGELEGESLLAISRIANYPIRIEERETDDGAGSIKKFRLPIWFEPVSGGGTPMNAAFSQALDVLRDWIQAHPDSYPPILINLTDAEFTDEDPSNTVKAIKNLQTSDGKVLVFNCHISSSNSSSIRFPAVPSELPDKHARLLFDLSSELPHGMAAVAKELNVEIPENARGFVFNASIVDLIKFLDIGTRPTTELR